MPDQELGGAADFLRVLLDRSLGGAYRIDRELGGGGMARVFLAEERALGRQVVVKVLSPELAHDLSAERFTRETRLSARLQHPNIVSVLTAGTAADLPYYTMPFIEGESLRSRLARLRPGERIPLAEALSVLRDVARALGYAHGHGVIHSDIKPENILLDQDTAMVADFGIAKAKAAARTQGPLPSGVTLTQGGMTLGRPAYMSPEQAAGDPVLDQRTDLYAWGIVAYELMAGIHPFARHHSVQALVTAHLAEQPRSLDEVVPHLPGTVRSVVMRCLEKSPDSRPSNAREILDTLADVKIGLSGSTGAAAARKGRVGPRWGSLPTGLVQGAGDERTVSPDPEPDVRRGDGHPGGVGDGLRLDGDQSLRAGGTGGVSPPHRAGRGALAGAHFRHDVGGVPGAGAAVVVRLCGRCIRRRRGP